ncbi:MAG: hypothetical protein K8S27_10055 [Candidatus Omnitrophica bacterium]|nr:hypothetical protein [Candidatus Omnitrophota bacterium]
MERLLKKYHIPYVKRQRGTKSDITKFNLILSFGGDGTFLEAARVSPGSFIVGINSAPNFSVGCLCTMTPQNAENFFIGLSTGQYAEKTFHKINVLLPGHKNLNAINDVLIAHKNPAATSRYLIKIDKTSEEQRSSGIWISTPIGSTAGIMSAGGKQIEKHQNKFQYMPREIYVYKNIKYKLTGSILKSTQQLHITSFMRQGMIFIDGSHCLHPFPYGARIRISLSATPLKTIILKK